MGDLNKYFTVGVLMCINLLNYMDRFTIAGILNNLEDKDRNGFVLRGNPEGVDDTEGGLLQTAFIGSYMILSPVFGYLGDRYRRKYIITVGILLWSAFTLVGSFSVNYWMLLATRLVVGVGEASYATIAPTMIADLFPADKRLRMLAIFYIAMPVGSALGYMVGSEVSVLVHDITHMAVTWRWAMRVTPVLGVVCALLVFFFVKEPVRGSSEQRLVNGVKGKAGIKAYLGDLWYLCNNFTFITSTLGFTAVAFTTGALAQWAPTFIQRVSSMIYPGHGYGDSTAAIGFGAVAVCAGIVGTVMGSELSKFLGQYTRKAEALVCSMAMLVGTPFLFMSLVVVQYQIIGISWACVFFATLSTCLVWTPVAAMLLYSVVPAKRATASAIQILVSHLFGDSMSPTIVGAVSDAVYRYVGPAQGYDTGKAVSMEFGLLITAIVMLLGGGAFLMSTLFVENDRRVMNMAHQVRNWRIYNEFFQTVALSRYLGSMVCELWWKVELAAQKVNSQIQHTGHEKSGSVSGEGSSGDLERKELLSDAEKQVYCRERKHVPSNYNTNSS